MSTALPPPVKCRAGCAAKVITPPVGVSLAGYFHDRISEGVRDDLFAKALVLEHEGVCLALVACDLISIEGQLADAAKQLIEQRAGIPPSHVLINATHTHTGPECRSGCVVPRADEWAEKLPERIAESVTEAAGRMFAATLRPNRTCVEGLSFNRLWRVKDGQEVFGRPADAIGPAGPIDPEMVVVGVVDEEDRLRAVLANFALHVDVIGGGGAKYISADWPGEMGRAIAAVYGDDVVTVFLQGTCGDINHCTHYPTHLPTGGPEKSIQIGRALAGAAMYAVERAEPVTTLTLAAELERIPIPYYTRDEKLMAEIAALKQRPDIGDFERYLIARTEAWPHDGQSVDTPVHCLRLGDVSVVGLPAEIFVRIGLEIKHWSPAEYTMVAELANTRASTYVPTTDQAERGAYGAKPILSRWLCADAGRRMADQAQVMLRRMWP
jgi:hypothetical protein